MLCFDKLKIVTSTDCIEKFDESKFQSAYKNGKLQYHKYVQTTPCKLLIMINCDKNELVMEFTSKILGIDFINLINEETIGECLLRLERLVEFNVDVEDIIENSEVVKCDVTQDVTCNEDMNTLKRYVNSNLTNYDKWKCEPYRYGFVLRNIAATHRYKKRISVYDKEKELQKATNKDFFNQFDDDCFLQDYFRGKIRIELNINTKIQIRELLGIPDNKLANVLRSKANPILAVLNEALTTAPENACPVCTVKEYHYILTLQDCGNDLGKVEAKLRTLISRNTSITKAMKPYREFYRRMQPDIKTGIDIRSFIS
jgi:hypothetical protein